MSKRHARWLEKRYNRSRRSVATNGRRLMEHGLEDLSFDQLLERLLSHEMNQCIRFAIRYVWTVAPWHVIRA
jgi:hypothetical protein